MFSKRRYFITYFINVSLFYQSQSVIREDEGDKFRTSNCLDCQIDNAYCFSQTLCKCEYRRKIYFKVNADQPGCVSNPTRVEQCKFYISDIGSRKHLNSVALNTHHILGEIKPVRRAQKCQINDAEYWINYSNWGKLFDGVQRSSSDFSILESGNGVLMRFMGKDSLYTGLIIKLHLQCGTFQSCMVFTSFGKAVSIEPSKNGSAHISTTAKPTSLTTMDLNLAVVPTDKKENNMPKWLFAVIIGLSLFAVAIVIVSCVYCFKHKKGDGSGTCSYNRKPQRPRENTLTGTALLSVGHKDSIPEIDTDCYKTENDDNVYLDPEIVFHSDKKPKDSNYDYAYMNNHNLKNKDQNKPVTATNHEYADIVPDHPYDDPYVVPCPESRKSIGYAVLDGATQKQLQRGISEYQPLTIQHNAGNDKKKSEDGDPDSPEYFQLEDNPKQDDEKEESDNSDIVI